MIKKVICEENKATAPDSFVYRSLSEWDCNIATENREYIVPRREGSTKKRLNTGNIRDCRAAGLVFSVFSFDPKGKDRGYTSISCVNPLNARAVPIGEEDRIKAIRSREDLREPFRLSEQVRLSI